MPSYLKLHLSSNYICVQTLIDKTINHLLNNKFKDGQHKVSATILIFNPNCWYLFKCNMFYYNLLKPNLNTNKT